jgi:hypothetical protein
VDVAPRVGAPRPLSCGTDPAPSQSLQATDVRRPLP